MFGRQNLGGHYVGGALYLMGAFGGFYGIQVESYPLSRPPPAKGDPDLPTYLPEGTRTPSQMFFLVLGKVFPKRCSKRQFWPWGKRGPGLKLVTMGPPLFRWGGCPPFPPPGPKAGFELSRPLLNHGPTTFCVLSNWAGYTPATDWVHFAIICGWAVCLNLTTFGTSPLPGFLVSVGKTSDAGAL